MYLLTVVGVLDAAIISVSVNTLSLFFLFPVNLRTLENNNAIGFSDVCKDHSWKNIKEMKDSGHCGKNTKDSSGPPFSYVLGQWHFDWM